MQRFGGGEDPPRWICPRRKPYKRAVLAAGIGRGWVRGARRSVPAWALAIALALLCPLAGRLSPFAEVGTDPMRALLTAWSLPAALAGASLAWWHLGHQRAFLARVAPATRWIGELGTLALGAAVAQAFLLGGAVLGGLGGPRWPDALGSWLTGSALMDVHIAAAGALLLRVPGPTHVGFVGFWSLLWFAPRILGDSKPTFLVDASRHLWNLETEPVSARRIVASLALVLGLVLASAGLSIPRSVRPRSSRSTAS